MKSPAVKNVSVAPETQPRSDTRHVAIEIARLALGSRCHSVNVLDVSEVSSVTDFMILATGTSGRQMKGVADEIEDFANEHGHTVINRTRTNMGAGEGDEQWILLDFVDFVVHLFQDEARQFYDLDSLWGDAKKVQWKEKKD